MWPNERSAGDGGIPALFQVGRARPAASFILTLWGHDRRVGE